MGVCGLAAMISLTGSNISGSAISREGQDFYLMKILPVSYRKQVHAKLVPGIAISLACWLLILIVVQIIIQLDWLIFLLFCWALCLNIICIQYAACLLDIYFSKLNWENEAELLRRQNVNFLTMLVTATVAAIEIGSLYLADRFLSLRLVHLYLLGFILPALVFAVAAWLFYRFGLAKLARLEA